MPTLPTQQSAAQQELALLKQIRIQYGITINKYMDLKSICAQWTRAVLLKPSLVTDCPILSAAMLAGEAALNGQDVAVLAADVAMKLKNTEAQVALLLGAANPLTPCPAYIAAEAATIGLNLALQAETLIIQAAIPQLEGYIAQNPCH